ncbi:MAG: GH3 auxin-responsive promoter family protein [Bacteroidota bacterium]|nr:GH3 auxin-responsive promoter family protein [Bacteroidota bacterium]
MAILNSLITWMMTKRVHQIDLFLKYPLEVQNELFKKLIYSAKDTEWGIKYDYKSISSIKEFQERVPLQDYEKVKPYVERLMKGEQNLLWPTNIKWFAKSSGTTQEKSKFIPVSNESLEICHFKGGKDLCALYFSQYPDSLLFDGKCLALGGSHQINRFDNDSYYGDLSAILIQNLPFWVEFYRTPNLAISLMDKWEEKIDKMAHATIKEKVTNIAGVPSWMLVLMRKVLEISGKSNILDVWPNLELITHGGVNFEPYEEQFRSLIPSGKVNFLETYNASEGFFGIQDRLNIKDMLLMLDYGIFYEFIPMDEFHSENPHTVLLDEVKTDTNYAIVISTNAGLWRYIIGDTIRFTTLNPFRIRVTGRTRSFINAFGEELIVENSDKAIAIASQTTEASVKEYTAAPIYLDQKNYAAHEWFIEFITPPEDIEYFTDTLDNALKSLNSDYEAKRSNDMILKKPVIHILPEGTFYKWLKSNNKLGGQHKIPRLSNDRKYVDEIIEIMNK